MINTEIRSGDDAPNFHENCLAYASNFKYTRNELVLENAHLASREKQTLIAKRINNGVVPLKTVDKSHHKMFLNRSNFGHTRMGRLTQKRICSSETTDKIVINTEIRSGDDAPNFRENFLAYVNDFKRTHGMNSTSEIRIWHRAKNEL